MKIKTAELEGIALDWAVAKCESITPEDLLLGSIDHVIPHPHFLKDFHPSQDRSHGGLIIDREGISIIRCNDLYFPKGNENGDFYEQYWKASITQQNLPPGAKGQYKNFGPTPLIAAMRCFVSSKLGPEIEIPDEVAPQQPTRKPAP